MEQRLKTGGRGRETRNKDVRHPVDRGLETWNRDLRQGAEDGRHGTKT
jgi:hypothetical protein